MYDLIALEKHMRAARLELGRAPLPNSELPHLMSWSEYLCSVLALDPLLSGCVAIDRFFCSPWELEHDHCAPLHFTCQSQWIPFSGANGTLTKAPAPTSLQQLQALPDALLTISGDWLWYFNLFSLIKQSGASKDQLSEEPAKAILSDLYPDLHPTLMHRAGEVIQSLRLRPSGNDSAAAANRPVLALHIRLGDLRSRLSDLETRVTLMRQAAIAWRVNPLSPAVFIATDSRDASDHAVMQRSFPSAQIGFPVASGLVSDPPVIAVLLDKAACVDADYFVGSVGSTYSIAIHMLRTRMSKASKDQAMV